MLTGSCLCGAVAYTLGAPLASATHCHCSQCRKAHGAAFATYASVPKTALRFTRGAERVRTFNSSPGVARTFCDQCGATLQWMEVDSDSTCIALGTLDSPLGPIPQTHIFVDSKADWFAIRDGLPQDPNG
ncbi:GFA family protein [Pseudomonas sp. RIT-PI-AD]|uniref:GFA family protein n=1 Tax=Pseudomonas sp. RIT-PI-AD TaxID=3035294 RepID=UPI0021DA7804|nr:GFA family protein [Pseudomonas sp. RIT-PI-AD]